MAKIYGKSTYVSRYLYPIDKADFFILLFNQDVIPMIYRNQALEEIVPM